MKQERTFRLFIDGQMKYYNPSSGEEKGTINIDKDTKVKKKGKGEYQIVLPSQGKLYLLLNKDQTKCPAKSREFNCDIEDWI